MEDKEKLEQLVPMARQEQLVPMAIQGQLA